MLTNDDRQRANKLCRENICRVPDTIDFPGEEEKTLETWQKAKTFERCMQLSKGKPKYTFYDGPPFATGLPHYGHILAGTIKDIVTRYAYQQGYHVDRRFGWDCHGLPVEFEIDKMLNIRGPEDVEKMGITAYNAECRKIVMRYANDWETIVTRLGRWIDFKNDYKTLYPWYMETIWWVFKQLYDKGLVYRGVKVMPYSTACTTPLSNFESGQNYKEVVDPCVVVALKSVTEENTWYLVWTTTPWTLPSNYACCVNAKMTYVKAQDIKTDRLYVLAESRLSYVYKTEADYKIVAKFLGTELVGRHYEPLFPYFAEKGSAMKAFRILCDDYVTEDSGTGIVHNAPYFGEDDHRVCLAAGIITKSSTPICPVDNAGRFTPDVTDFAGKYVKDADKEIIGNLNHRGVLVWASQTKHSYPFCWRSDTPLIYKAVPSWFVRVEHMSKNLLACSAQTHWVPEFVKEKRFGNWLKEARDWAISRNRYWGTPIPLWISPSGDEIVCVGSIQQLEQLTGKRITDLHRENVDNLEIPSAIPGHPPLRRISDVFDCWFESGSMPYAQQHYPFSNQQDFNSSFPADFIAEGIDQTRGWFYTLLVISTALFNKPPFKNLIANGLVLAADGQKMSKRKQNYPDPMLVVSKYGADALRLYLINSPVVRAENLRFKEEGVHDIIRDVFLPWYNAYRFLLQNIARYEKQIESNAKGDSALYMFDRSRHEQNLPTSSVLDIWIVSFKESLLAFVASEMRAYRLYTVVPRLTKFIEQLCNWYVRLNRRRLKGDLGLEQCLQSLDTLYEVLWSMTHMMAPFTPYLAEYLYQRLVVFQPQTKNEGIVLGEDSVHFQMMPTSRPSYIREDIERSVALMQSVIDLGRVMRDRRTMPLKYPVTELIVIHQDQCSLDAIAGLQEFISSELNVRNIILTTDKDKYGCRVRVEPDHKVLGQRLKGDYKKILSALKELTDDEIQKGLKIGYLEVAGHRLEWDALRCIHCTKDDGGANGNYEVHSDNEVVAIMDMTPTAELLEEGLAREIINRVQKLKKKAKLIPTDPVIVQYKITGTAPGAGIDGSQLLGVIKSFASLITTTIQSEFQAASTEGKQPGVLTISELVDIKGIQLKLDIYATGDASQVGSGNVDLSNGDNNSNWCNLLLADDLQPRFGNTQREVSLRWQEAKQGASLTEEKCLRREIELVFGIYGVPFEIFTSATGKVPERLTFDSKLTLGQRLLIVTRDQINASKVLNSLNKNNASKPFPKALNNN